MLLPQSMESEGPEQASGRPERILRPAADINMRDVHCITAAEEFQVLRPQAPLRNKDRVPGVAPRTKSLSRHPFTASAPNELAEGHWQQVIGDAEAEARAADVRRLILCSGKVAVDLFTSAFRQKSPSVAICRVEQLYPLPIPEIEEMI